jgi:hypothetical protein
LEAQGFSSTVDTALPSPPQMGYSAPMAAKKAGPKKTMTKAAGKSGKDPKTAKKASTHVQKPDRVDPSRKLREQVLREAGFMCANPRCRAILVLELHHVVWVKDGGPTDASNLLALCRNCHGLHTINKIDRETIRHWKGLLVALNSAFNRESMDLLLFLKQPAAQELWISGDGVLRFAGLIAARLVEMQNITSGGQRSTRVVFIPNGSREIPPPMPTPGSAVKLRLTERGTALVDSWLDGDDLSYAKALGGEASTA